MGSLSDALLLTRVHAGDPLALEALFERYEATLFAFLLGLLRDHQRAEDALQETFIKALTASEGVDPERIKSWLFTVGYREAMQIRRREKRLQAVGDAQPFLQLADPLPAGAQRVEAADRDRRLRELLEQLPRPQRDVIVARIYHGKRFREIANELGCPLNTALARMHDGLKRLRTLWEASDA